MRDNIFLTNRRQFPAAAEKERVRTALPNFFFSYGRLGLQAAWSRLQPAFEGPQRFYYIHGRRERPESPPV